MSEYHYYEFRSVDRLLTQHERSMLRRLSSRATITSQSLVNTYNYGDFAGDPRSLMRSCFDAFIYVGCWRTYWFMLRVPKKLLSPRDAQAYATPWSLGVEETSDDVILSFHSEHRVPATCDNTGEEWMPALLPVRDGLMAGDHRALYLGWLLGVQNGEVDEEALEPPVPAGLRSLDASLVALAELLEVDRDLLDAAAEGSAPMRRATLSPQAVRTWIEALPPARRKDLLVSFVMGDDPHLARQLRLEVAHVDRAAPSSPPGSQRTVAELLLRAEHLGRKRRAREALERQREQARREREAAERRRRHIESLRGRARELWTTAHQLVVQGTGRPEVYDRAVAILCDLRELAELEETQADFQDKLRAFVQTHRRKSALVARVRNAKLLANQAQ